MAVRGSSLLEAHVVWAGRIMVPLAKYQDFHSKTNITGNQLLTNANNSFVQRGSEPSTQEASDRGAITGPMMAQYLMALLSLQRQGGMRAGGGMQRDPFFELSGRTNADGAHEGNGRWGDYVFNQEGEDYFHFLLPYLTSDLSCQLWTISSHN